MSAIWQWILKWIMPSLVTFLKEIFTEARQKAIDALRDIAIEAVTELSKTDLSSDDKRKSAIQKIKDFAVAKGLDVKDSTISLMVELAVAKLKG